MVGRRRFQVEPIVGVGGDGEEAVSCRTTALVGLKVAIVKLLGSYMFNIVYL